MSRNNYLEKEIAHKGHTIKIYRDEDSESPREWDNLGIIYSNHRRWDPDRKGINDLIREVGGNIYEDTIPFDRIAKTHYFLKVWMYDHSGQTIRVADHNPFNDPWDSGQIGWIYTEHAKVDLFFGAVNDSTLSQARERPENEVSTWNDYIMDENYAYDLVNEQTGEVIDGGFWTGDVESLKAYAFNTALELKEHSLRKGGEVR